ncbi:MAG TPA: hypothetical protein VHA11_04480 [Bryobacteraceae bacterium]|nr:hypothetical protein [Bryobacteraceae bacterium]
MEMKVSGVPVQGKKQYNEPKLVLHGDISEITLHLLGNGKRHKWPKNKEHHS